MQATALVKSNSYAQMSQLAKAGLQTAFLTRLQSQRQPTQRVGAGKWALSSNQRFRQASMSLAKTVKLHASACAAADSGAVSDACREEVYQYKITRNTNINLNVPLGMCCTTGGSSATQCCVFHPSEARQASRPCATHGCAVHLCLSKQEGVHCRLCSAGSGRGITREGVGGDCLV